MVIINKIRFGKRNFGILSPLESDVLSLLWKKEKGMRVRDIHYILYRKKKVALTSVAVILDRLHEKNIVTRNIKKGIGGEYYIYYPTSREQFEKSIIEKTVNGLIDNFGHSAVSYFNERFSKKSKKLKNN